MRLRTATLSREQHRTVLPHVQQLVASSIDPTDDAARAIAMEVVARLTPAMSLSEAAIAQVVTEEIDAYQADPYAYLVRSQQTAYRVLALQEPPPADLGRLPPEVAPALAAERVPTVADDWVAFAHAVDAPRLASLLGFELGDLGYLMRHRFQRHGRWQGSLLDLRLALAYEAQAWLRGRAPTLEPGYPRVVERLLGAIREAAGRSGVVGAG